MVVFAYAPHFSDAHYGRHIVFKVTIERLVLTVLNFQIREVSPAVLRCQRSFFHVQILVLFLFLGVYVGCAMVDTGHLIAIILVVKTTVGGIVRYLGHTYRVNRHRVVSLLSHSEHFAHLRWCGSSTVEATTHGVLLNDSVLLPQVLEVGVLQSLGGA